MNHIDYIVLAVALIVFASATALVISHYGLRLPNFKGDKIPTIGGLSMLLFGEFAYAYIWFVHGIKTGSAAISAPASGNRGGIIDTRPD